MHKAYLLVNAGSSSLKVSLSNVNSGEVLASAQVDWSGDSATLRFSSDQTKIKETAAFNDHASALKAVLLKIEGQFGNNLTIDAIAHRVVHGGDIKSGVLITPELLEKLKKLSPLAPLHNPPSLAAIDAALSAFPNIPQVAVFDTAFHRNMREEAQQYALPQEWTNDWGIRRYGFHGLSHSYCAQRAAEMLGQVPETTKLIICHLGHGCSASATIGARSVDTTMGFTPLEGLMMATRSGNIDAGAVLYAQENFKLTPEKVSKVLNNESGLLGVSGVSSDLRKLIEAADSGHSASRLAISMFCYSVQKAIASLMVSIGNADALVFTAGIGENSAMIRDQICRGVTFLGFEIDPAKNENCKLDANISATSSKSQVLVIATREDISMARELRAVLLKREM